jgi:DNA-binding MarR family transcriptional regulator
VSPMGDSIRLSPEEADDLRRRITVALRAIGQQLLETTDEPSPDAIDRTGAMLELYAELLRVAGGEEVSEELVERIANRDIEVLAGSEVLRRLETWDGG